MGQEKIQEEQRGGFATIAKNLTIAHIPESINIFLVLGLEKKSEVARCQTLLTNRAEFQRIRKKVEEAENAGISPSLSKSTLNNSHSRPATTTCPIAKSFGTVERHQVDILIVRALCANGIPFNVLRNPDFLAMLKGVNQAPKDYKRLSFDRARTTLVDECQRELEKELMPVKDTWTTHGTSIVSDGWIDATTMSPISWWSTYASETPELAEIAIRVLSQPISSSSAERVWSTYSYIHNIKRNRLNAKRADKLVFIHSNIRLLSRFTTSYKEGPCKKWVIDPESTYFDDSIVRLEDLRWVD
ncbi:hypothetical protein GQ457_15G017470 [Hibiscus cannabinus]